jgi:hypothetical protein
MKILGVIIFYDDGPELLERSLKSLKKVTDKVLAIDGAYREFPHKDFLSQKASLDVVKSLADQVIIPEKEWHDEPAKRNAYLKLKSTKDYYLMLDADEEVTGTRPANLTHPVYRISLSTKRAGVDLAGYYNRLFRHHVGMRYHLTHNNLILKDGTSLSIPDDHIPICQDIKIFHYPEQRPQGRQEQDGHFEKVKEEGKIVLPTQTTPAANVDATPIKVKYLGQTIYRGFDIVNNQTVPVMCNQNDIVLLSRNKFYQLNKDFPGSWLLIKDLAQ